MADRSISITVHQRLLSRNRKAPPSLPVAGRPALDKPDIRPTTRRSAPPGRTARQRWRQYQPVTHRTHETGLWGPRRHVGQVDLVLAIAIDVYSTDVEGNGLEIRAAHLALDRVPLAQRDAIIAYQPDLEEADPRLFP